MKIAILSDIHGNFDACKNVFKEMRQCGVDMVFVLGDIVGYYYQPERVFEALEKWKMKLIGGNHESMLKRSIEDSDYDFAVYKKYGSGIRIARRTLCASWLHSLITASNSMKLEVDGIIFALFHGSPWEQDFYIYPDTNKDILDKSLQVEADVVLVGHTHYPFLYQKENKLLLNPGSVGQARDVGGSASWVLFDTRNRSFVFKKTPYDVKSLIYHIKNTDSHVPYLWNVLQR